MATPKAIFLTAPGLTMRRQLADASCAPCVPKVADGESTSCTWANSRFSSEERVLARALPDRSAAKQNNACIMAQQPELHACLSSTRRGAAPSPARPPPRAPRPKVFLNFGQAYCDGRHGKAPAAAEATARLPREQRHNRFECPMRRIPCGHHIVRHTTHHASPRLPRLQVHSTGPSRVVRISIPLQPCALLCSCQWRCPPMQLG